MITVQFKDFDDMMTFAKQMCGVATVATKTEPEAVSTVPASTKPAAPAVPQPAQPPVASAPVPTVPQLVPAPAAPPASTVPTSTVSYTLDDLARAAMPLMDTGRQGDLLGLLATFGVEALPALPQAQYGAFATKLREMGAQI